MNGSHVRRGRSRSWHKSGIESHRVQCLIQIVDCVAKTLTENDLHSSQSKKKKNTSAAKIVSRLEEGKRSSRIRQDRDRARAMR